MRKINRLLCAAAAAVLLGANTAQAAVIIVPPNPLTAATENTSASQIISQGPGAELLQNTQSQTSQTEQVQQSLEGTVFAGSSTIAAPVVGS